MKNLIYNYDYDDNNFDTLKELMIFANELDLKIDILSMDEYVSGEDIDYEYPDELIVFLNTLNAKMLKCLDLEAFEKVYDQYTNSIDENKKWMLYLYEKGGRNLKIPLEKENKLKMYKKFIKKIDKVRDLLN